MATEILLIRHSSLKVPRGFCYGFYDMDVSENFTNEVEQLQHQIAYFNPEKVYCSTLKRCTKMADILYPNTYVTDERLKELNYGDWENKEWKDINVPEKENWIYTYPHLKTPNGESFSDLKLRVEDFFNHLQNQPHQKVAIVCHGGVIRSFISSLLQIPLDLSQNFKIHYAGHVVLKLDENKWKIFELQNI